MRLRLDRRASPIGTMLVITDGAALRVLDFHDYGPRMERLLKRHYGAVTLEDGPAPAAVTEPLDAYFSGEIAAIDRIETATGGTEFQRRAWSALRRIPHGETWSYGRQAREMGQPTAGRAVGMANGQNPIAIVVPCHRVIGANASLTGYGGGLDRKRWLLRHEGCAFKGDADLFEPAFAA